MLVYQHKAEDRLPHDNMCWPVSAWPLLIPSFLPSLTCPALHLEEHLLAAGCWLLAAGRPLATIGNIAVIRN